MADTDKTEPATGKRRHEARERGQVAKSPEINTAIILITGFMLLRYLTPHMYSGIEQLMTYCFGHLASFDFTEEGVFYNGLRLMLATGVIVMPFILGIAGIAIVISLIQVGFLSSTSVIKPQFSRINPIAGFKRFFSARAFVELAKSLIKILITVFVAYFVIKPEIEGIMFTMDMSPAQSASFIAKLVLRLGFRLGFVFAGFAILDYIYQRWEFERSLRMSKQEVRDELIRYEGRPEVRHRIRSIQRQLAMRRMMQDVPKADVVITNPTHLAVALRYDPKDMTAPKVVAKGARLVAKRIVELAKANNVPVMENKPIARMLFKLVEIGQFIPLQLYQAVADILAFVWRTGKLKRKIF